MFQQYGLLPWRTVQGNVALGVEFTDLLKNEKTQRAQEYIKLVGLADHTNAKPAELSGGMQQRVALARSVASHHRVLFMDEPFGALDEVTRIRLRRELETIWKQENITIVFVTHSIDDALMLGDTIAVISDSPGKIQTILDVPLPRPRDITCSTADKMRKEILQLLGV